MCKLSNSEIASLLKTLTALVEKLASATSNPPSVKRHRPAESDPISDMDDERDEGGQETVHVVRMKT